MLLSFIVKFVQYLSLNFEKNENKQKEAGFGPFLSFQSHHFQSGKLSFKFVIWILGHSAKDNSNGFEHESGFKSGISCRHFPSTRSESLRREFSDRQPHPEVSDAHSRRPEFSVDRCIARHAAEDYNDEPESGVNRGDELEVCQSGKPWSSLVVVGDEGWIAQAKSYCVHVKPDKFLQHMA